MRVPATRKVHSIRHISAAALQAIRRSGGQGRDYNREARADTLRAAIQNVFEESLFFFITITIFEESLFFYYYYARANVISEQVVLTVGYAELFAINEANQYPWKDT